MPLTPSINGTALVWSEIPWKKNAVHYARGWPNCKPNPEPEPSESEEQKATVTHTEYMRGWRRRNPEKCRSAEAKWRAGNREHCLQYRREWMERNREYMREYMREYHRRWVKRNLIKKAAWSAVQHAIESGKLVRPACCSRCGLVCAAEAHHKDHSKKLEIVWLCRSCHGVEHAKQRKERKP